MHLLARLTRRWRVRRHAARVRALLEYRHIWRTRTRRTS